MPFLSTLQSSATSSQKTLENFQISSNWKSNNKLIFSKKSIAEKEGHGIQNTSVPIIPVPGAPIIPVPSQEESTPGSPIDIVIILSISFLFILFFFLWTRAYYDELERKRIEKRRQQWQAEQELQMLVNIENLWIYEEEFWKRLYPECLPIYSEQNVLVHEGMRSNLDMAHGLNIENGILSSQVVGDEIQSSEQVADIFGFESIAQIRTPPPAYTY